MLKVVCPSDHDHDEDDDVDVDVDDDDDEQTRLPAAGRTWYVHKQEQQQE